MDAPLMSLGPEPALASARAAPDTLAALRALLGEAHVLTGEPLRAYATDVFRQLALPLAMVSPASVEQLQAVVTLAASAGLALVPRGGGSSYTDGYLPTEARSLLLDLRRLNRIVEINEADAYVTVEAGVTWDELARALAARGLRTPFRGPFSGAVATVGGSMAQHAISHGTAAHGMSGASVLSLDVVLADGQLLRTGSALLGASPFFRHCGPDLSGLFLGDCGALGIKARITLALLRARADFAAASFGFASFERLHAAMAAVAREGVDDTHFAIDAAMVRGQLRRPRGPRATLEMARRVWQAAPHPLAALLQLARMALAGERALATSNYLAHYIIEGSDAPDVASKLRRLRRVMHGQGQEITNTIPTVVRNQPFERMFHVLGPGGERWLPVHGLLPHSRVPGFFRALTALLHTHAPYMRQHGVWIGSLYECIGAGGFTIELGLYWPDATSAYHRAAVAPATLASLPVHAENLVLRDWIARLRLELIDLYQAHGAVHFQLGKVYPYASAIEHSGLTVARAIKQALDPLRRMNPGALGL